MPGHDAFLLALKMNPGITMGALAEQLEITASSATKIAIKMETAGLIRREASRIDNRQNHAFLTENGTAVVEEIITAYENLDNKLINNAKPKDIERGLKLFDRLETDPSSAAKTPKKAGGKKNKKKKNKDQKSSSKNQKKTISRKST